MTNRFILGIIIALFLNIILAGALYLSVADILLPEKEKLEYSLVPSPALIKNIPNVSGPSFFDQVEVIDTSKAKKK